MNKSPWSPLPGQRTFLEARAPVKVLACGRRWGKSDAAAREVFLGAVSSRSLEQMIVAPSYDQARLIFERVIEMLEKEATRRFTVGRQPYPYINLMPGRVTARSAARGGMYLRGHGAHRVVVDEAAYVPESVIYEVINPMLAQTRGDLCLLSTPCGKNHFYRAFLKGQEGHPHYWSLRSPTTDHGLVSAEFIAAQRELMTDRQFRTEYMAEFMDSAEAVFAQQWLDCAASLDHADSVGLQPISLGVDWARYRDYTAVVVLQGSHEKSRVVATDRFNLIAWSEQVERVVSHATRHAVGRVLCDRTSVGDPLLEQLQARLTHVAVDGIVFTNDSKRALIDRLVLALERERLEIGANQELLRELHHFEHRIGPSGNVTLNAAAGSHDDLVIALTLALAALPETCDRPRFASSGRRRDIGPLG